jgi:hypothetical protein
MKTENLILIGAIGIGIYFLWKNGVFGGEGFASGGGGFNELGGESGGGTVGGGVKVAIPPARGKHSAAGSRQAWTGVTYGQTGQPSVRFLTNTLNEAQQSAASPTTKMAAAAAYAGAPPRMVAKIKAGKVW